MEAAKKAVLEAPTPDNARAYLRAVAEHGDALEEEEAYALLSKTLLLKKDAMRKTVGAMRRQMAALKEEARHSSGRIFKKRDDVQMQVNSIIITKFSMPDREWEYEFDVTYFIDDGREARQIDDHFVVKQSKLLSPGFFMNAICKATKCVLQFEDFASTLEMWLRTATSRYQDETPRTAEKQMIDSILDMIGKMPKTEDWELYKSQPFSYVFFERDTDSYYLAAEVIQGVQQQHKTALPPQTIRRVLCSYMHEGEAKQSRLPQQDKKLRAWRFIASTVDDYYVAPPLPPTDVAEYVKRIDDLFTRADALPDIMGDVTAGMAAQEVEEFHKKKHPEANLEEIIEWFKGECKAGRLPYEVDENEVVKKREAKP